MTCLAKARRTATKPAGSSFSRDIYSFWAYGIVRVSANGHCICTGCSSRELGVKKKPPPEGEAAGAFSWPGRRGALYVPCGTRIRKRAKLSGLSVSAQLQLLFASLENESDSDTDHVVRPDTTGVNRGPIELRNAQGQAMRDANIQAAADP